MPDTIEIKSFAQYIKLLEEDTQFDKLNLLNGNTLYRGQNCDLPLLPKIGRYKKSIDDLLEIELALIEEFEKRSIPFLGFEPDNDWDFLACAQHFGLPTRLLDWSENPLIALWFAVANGESKSKNGVVWVLDVKIDDIIDNLNKDPLKIKKQQYLTQAI